MANVVRFHPSVAVDLAAATQWYDGISHELGNRFRRSVGERLDAVQLRPESFGRVQGEIRAARVPGFPYLVLFEHDKKAIHIHGVFHAASDPSKWKGRG